jgi:hypothetical protein
MCFWVLLSHAMMCGSGWAGFQFRDPGIPDGETITYKSQSDGTTMVMKEHTRQINDGPTRQYEIASLSPVLDTYIRINRNDMTVASVHTIQKYDTATLDSKLIIRDAQPNTRDDAVKVPHFVALSHLLRGFPFESRKKILISYYGGSAEKKFTLCVRSKKQELITIQGRELLCYKLEFGVDGLLGTILPELELWYTVKAPHYMVRYRGPEGPPGTPERFIELTGYSVP